MLSTLRTHGVRSFRQHVSKWPHKVVTGDAKPPFFRTRSFGSKGNPSKNSETVEQKSARDGSHKTDPKNAKGEPGKSHTSNNKGDAEGQGNQSLNSKKWPSSWNMSSVVKYVCGAATISYLLSYLASKEASAEITVQEMLREYLMKGYVERICIVNRSYCRVILLSDAPIPAAGKVLLVQLGAPESFEAKVEQVQSELGLKLTEQVPLQYITETSFAETILPYLPTLLILGSLLFVGRGASRGVASPPNMGGGRNLFNIGKARTAATKDLKSKVTFADVAGLGQAKKEVVEFVDFLKDSKRYEKLGARIPKGGLLVGPPGTGKTLLAKAVAGEAGVPFFSTSGSEFVEMYSGVGPSRVRDLFQQARASAPSIIFIDEIDAIGRKRGSGGGVSGGSSSERENTLNQLLVEMDGFSSAANVIVLAGTNRADILDDALKRPGRFDRHIAVDKPDLTERKEIFEVHLKPVTLDESLNAETVADRMAALTPGFVGSDIANVCNEAAIFAARRHSSSVQMVDFERASERVIGGLEKSSGFMSAVEKRTVALHESGHAVAGWFLENADPLLKVSIIPRSNGALGFAQYLPQELSLYSKEAILDHIAVALAGRAAEELFVGRVTTGATDDLNKVTKMAYSMVNTYGMSSQLGLVSFGDRNASDRFYKPYSEETGRLIDLEVREIIDEQYARVKALLLESRELVASMADALAAKETLVHGELQDLLGARRPFALNTGNLVDQI